MRELYRLCMNRLLDRYFPIGEVCSHCHTIVIVPRGFAVAECAACHGRFLTDEAYQGYSLN